MVTFGGQSTYKQYVAARQQGSGLRRPYRLMLWPIAAVIALALLSPIFVGGADLANLTAFAIFVVVVAGIYVASRARTRRDFESDRSHESTTRGSADEHGITLASELGSAETPWTHFYKASMSRTNVLLHKSTQIAVYIPREFFSSEADWSEFVRLVRAGVKRPPLVNWRAVLGLAIWILLIVGLLLVWTIFGQGGG